MTIEKLNIIPNFFISETYINQPTIIPYHRNGWIWLEENGEPLFQALPLYPFSKFYKYPTKTYWASYPSAGCIRNSTFLDWQYIYDPKAFLNMAGGKWATFRKNSKKWINKNTTAYYSSQAPYKAICNLLHSWIQGRDDNSIEDGDFLINTILKANPKDYIKYLFNRDDELVAINYADENYKYINYRFVICNKEPYLDEYARFLFYTDKEIQDKNKLVNDGGTLDNKGLEKFKDKLNPVQKIKIYSL